MADGSRLHIPGQVVIEAVVAELADTLRDTHQDLGRVE